MIGFVVPVKPRNASKNWEYDNLLLTRTVDSICRQTNQNFKLIVVYNDLNIEVNHLNVVLLHFPYPTVNANEFEDLDYVLKYHPRAYAERMMDKGKRIMFGCKNAIELGCTYVMAVDSDDLVSNKIAEFVQQHSAQNLPGWRIKKGFIYEENSMWLLKKYDIQNINGSTHIIRKDLIQISDFNRNIFWNYNLFEAHGYTYFRLKDFHNSVLEDYPKYGIIYIIHRSNYSNISELTTRLSLRNFLKKILRGQLLSKRIRKEFNLYPLNVQ